MGNKRKALNSVALVESGVIHHQSNEPKIVLDKNRFVSIEAQMFYDKLALIASPFLERDIDFYGSGDDKINTLTAPGEVCCAFLSKISDRTWYKFVREDAIVDNDTIVREFITNTHKFIGTIVQVRKQLVNFSREIINAYYQILNIANSVTLRTGSQISPDKPITGPWIRLTLKKHDKSLQDVLAKHQPKT
ncbi:hypothetical protein ACH5RR_025758 [Cinchona calisaya]|uniref:Uncharacterized protein n=1 Tax=Cinchona calisaya TaxID=153742 RepID=A0ABD2Z2H6_9GENT